MKQKILAVALALVLGLAFLPALLAYFSPIGETLVLNGEESNAPGWRVFVVEDGIERELQPDDLGRYGELGWAGQTYYRSITLPQTLETPVLALGLVDLSAAVFLDGELVYTNAPQAGGAVGELQDLPYQTAAAEQVLISLPGDSGGKTLTIAQSLPADEPGIDGKWAYPTSAVLYTGGAYESGQIAQASRAALPAVLLAALGVVLLLSFCWQAFEGRWDWGLLCLAAFVFFSMADGQINAPFAPLYAFDQPYGIDGLARGFGVTALLLFLSTRLPRRWVLGAGAALQGAVTAVWAVFLFTENPLAYRVSALALKLDLLLILTGIVLAAVQAKKNKSFARDFCLLLAVLAGGYLLVELSGPLWQPGRLPQTLRLWGNAVQNAMPHYPLLLLRPAMIIAVSGAALIDLARQGLNRRAERAALEIRAQQAQESYRYMRGEAVAAMMVRHDHRNHLAVLRSLLEENQPQRALQYARELLEEEGRYAPVANSGNVLVDTILNSKLAQAQRDGIEVKLERLQLPPELPLPQADLCALLTNLLDNALRAAASPQAPAHWLQLDLYLKSGYFCVVCRNAASSSAVPSPAEKEEQAGLPRHGYGLKILRHLAEKHGGGIETTVLPESFEAKLVIPLPAAPQPGPASQGAGAPS